MRTKILETLEKFKTFPLGVKASILFLLSLMILFAVTLPGIFFVFFVIGAIAASLLRIFIYLTEIS